MQTAPARYVSVSELYSTDEVELLLDEIRELEPTSCCAEDIQDFEIAGSQSGAACGAGGAGGRSPVGTEHSWDSHAHYRRVPPPRPVPLAPIYCHLSHFITWTGFLRLLIVACSGGACGCAWGLVGVRAWLVPLSARLRLLQLAAFSSLLAHTLLLVLHVTHLTALFPFDFNKLGAWVCVWSGVGLSTGGGLVLHAVLLAPDYRHAPHYVAALLLAAAGLGVSGACISWAAAWRGLRAVAAEGAGARAAAGAGAGAAYRAVPQLVDTDDPL